MTDIMKTIKGIIILNLEGKRLMGKCYDDKINSPAFDKTIYNKTKNHKKRDDIFVLDSAMILHRHVTDLHVYIVGQRAENPLILDKVLHCLVEVITTIMNRNIEQQSFMNNLDQIILAFDEIVDDGIILETNPDNVLHRVCLRDDIGEQSMARVLQSATEHIKFPWIRS